MASVLPARPWRRSLSTWCNWNNKTNIHLLNHSNKTARVNMSTVIHIQHDASILQSRPNQLDGTYIAQITERTAIQIRISQLYTMLTVIHLPQSCLSPVSNHFSPQICLTSVKCCCSRWSRTRAGPVCSRRELHVISQPYSLIGWKICHYHTSPELNQFTAV